jgi:hypothetical protein
MSSSSNGLFSPFSVEDIASLSPLRSFSLLLFFKSSRDREELTWAVRLVPKTFPLFLRLLTPAVSSEKTQGPHKYENHVLCVFLCVRARARPVPSLGPVGFLQLSTCSLTNVTRRSRTRVCPPAC